MPASSVLQADMQQYIHRALQVTWNLATAVPPFIVSCDLKTFSDKHHEKASTAWDDNYDISYTLRYFRPVLFNISSGVQMRGCVAKLAPGKLCVSAFTLISSGRSGMLTQEKLLVVSYLKFLDGVKAL